MNTLLEKTDEEQGHDKARTIIVNGRQKTVTGKEISFEELVTLAFGNNPPTGENVVITVTFSKGEDGKQGSLLPGDTVKIKEDMIFNVTPTVKS
jgi:Multiubiquitin